MKLRFHKDEYVMYNLHDTKIPIYYKLLWVLRNYWYSYYIMVRSRFRNIKIGNIFSCFWSIVTNLVFCFKLTMEDLKTLEEDIEIYDELKLTFFKET